jgi:hypothetical protein
MMRCYKHGRPPLPAPLHIPALNFTYITIGCDVMRLSRSVSFWDMAAFIIVHFEKFEGLSYMAKAL